MNDQEMEKKAWRWCGYCTVLLFICGMCMMAMPDLMNRNGNEKDVFYGKGYGEATIFRASTGTADEFLSMILELEELKEECEVLEEQLEAVGRDES